MNIPTERTYEELTWGLIQMVRRIEDTLYKSDTTIDSDINTKSRVSKKTIVENIYVEKDFDVKENLTIKFLCVYEEGEKGDIESRIKDLANDVSLNKYELGINLLMLSNHAFKKNFHPNEETLQLVYKLVLTKDKNIRYFAIWALYWLSNGYLKSKGIISLGNDEIRKIFEILCFKIDNINSKKRLVHIISKAHPSYTSFEPSQKYLTGIKKSINNTTIKASSGLSFNENFNHVLTLYVEEGNKALKVASILCLGRGGYKSTDISPYLLEIAQNRNNLTQEREEALLYLSQYQNFENWETLTYMAKVKEFELRFLACCIGNNQVELLKKLLLDNGVKNKYKVAIVAYLFNNHSREWSILSNSIKEYLLNILNKYLNEKAEKLNEVMPKVSEKIFEELNTQYMIENELVYHLRFKKEQDNIFFILRIEQDKFMSFNAKLKGKGNLDLTEFGEVLYKGYGEPSDKIKEELKIKYGLYGE